MAPANPDDRHDDRLMVTDAVRIPRNELQVRFSVSGGPGGQHANKAATRVELSFRVDTSAAFDDAQRRQITRRLGDEVRVVADGERSQHRNREDAERRLVERLRVALHVDRARRPTRPTRGSQQRRLAAKRRRTETKRNRMRPSDDD